VVWFTQALLAESEKKQLAIAIDCQIVKVISGPQLKDKRL